MKKTVYLMIVGAMLLIPAASWAVPPVTLDPACDYVVNTTTGFNTQASNLLGIFYALGLFPAPVSLAEGDLENGFVGDGVPDKMQLNLLGAVLCSGDSLVVSQYNANLAAYLGLTTTVQNIFNDMGALAAAQGPMKTTATAIATWLATPQAVLGGATPGEYFAANSPTTLTQIQTVAGGLSLGADGINTFLTKNGGYVAVLVNVAPAFAAYSGLSTEMYATFQQLVNVEIFGGITDTAGQLNQLRDGCLLLAGAIPVPPMTPELATLLSDTATAINAVSTPMGSVTFPVMQIYGVAKGATEPFSGAADYNGNGDTNLQVYDNVVVANGGSVADFVAASSGGNPFYNGAPGLPVASLLGLTLLVSACGAAGAFSMRKK